MTGSPSVSVIVVSFNTRALTLKALESALSQTGLTLDVWVVDNASEDGSVQAIRDRFPEVRLLPQEENLGFGEANNRAMSRATGNYFLLLNSDAELRRSTDLSALVAAMETDPRVGVVGPRLESREGILEFSARRFPTLREEVFRRFGLHHLLSKKAREKRFLLEFFSHRERIEADWVTGACMLVRREVVERVGGFDPGIFMYGEEREWCSRVRAGGWAVVFDPVITVTHARGGSSPERQPWRRARGLEADLQFAAESGGRAYRGLFALTRWVGLLFEVSLFTVVSLASPTEYHRRRRRDAGAQLKAWTAILRGDDEKPL